MVSGPLVVGSYRTAEVLIVPPFAKVAREQLRKLRARGRFLVSARFKFLPQLTRQTAADFGRDVNRLEQMRHDGLELFHRARVERLLRSSNAFDALGSRRRLSGITRRLASFRLAVIRQRLSLEPLIFVVDPIDRHLHDGAFGITDECNPGVFVERETVLPGGAQHSAPATAALVIQSIVAHRDFLVPIASHIIGERSGGRLRRLGFWFRLRERHSLLLRGLTANGSRNEADKK